VSIDDLIQLLEIIERYSASTWITLVGVVVGAVALKQFTKKEADRKTRIWAAVSGSIAAVLIVACQALSLWYSHTASKVSPSAAFDALKKNDRVEWLVRLVPSDPSVTPSLSLDKLVSLGRPEDAFVFVADYEELKNFTVEEALYKTGGSLQNASHVSAIIFPRRGRDLYPASARGVLQVIQAIDKQHGSDPSYTPCPFKTLSQKAIDDLKRTDLTSWSWSGYSQFYAEYKIAVERAQADGCSAFPRIGTLGDDWHPAGYSQVLDNPTGDKLSASFRLSLPNGDNLELPNFGARAFLIANLALNSIADRVMIDFDNPEEDQIPSLAPIRGDSPGLK
jgi:hypothetical protein